MAKDEKNAGGVAGQVGAPDNMAAARAARSKGKSRTADLNSTQKFALRTVQQARNSLKKAQDAIILGMDIPADLIDACSRVNSAVGKTLFD